MVAKSQVRKKTVFEIVLDFNSVTQNPDVESLIKPEVLKVQQLVIWDLSGASSDMTNKLVLANI